MVQRYHVGDPVDVAGGALPSVVVEQEGVTVRPVDRVDRDHGVDRRSPQAFARPRRRIVGSQPAEWIDGRANGTRPGTASITKNGAPSAEGSGSTQRRWGTGTGVAARPDSTRASRTTSGWRKMAPVIGRTRTPDELGGA